MTYVEARCVGGGSEVNAGLYYRTPTEVLEAWRRDFAVADFAPEDLEAHFESIEKSLGVVETPEDASDSGIRLRIGAERRAVRTVASLSSLQRGVPRQDGTVTDQRASMTRTYLPHAFRNGARLIADCRVRSLRRHGGRWTIRCRGAPDGAAPRSLRVEADTVFVACGANTPALLQRSGVRRNVGRSLGMHATAKVSARFADDVNHATMGVPTQAIDEFAPRFFFTCANSSPGYLALEMMQYPRHFPKLADCWRRIAVYSARISGGNGRVLAIPGFADPVVSFTLGDDDLRDLSDAVRELSALLFEAGAERVYPSLLLGEPLRSPGDLDRIPMPLDRGLTNLMTIHLSSSCPMGENPDRAARSIRSGASTVSTSSMSRTRACSAPRRR